MGVKMKFEINLDKSYLWIPVQVHGEKTGITFRIEDKKVMEFNIPIGNDAVIDFYASIPIEEFVGKTLVLSGTDTIHFYNEIRVENIPYHKEDVARPEIHFTANTGWINDPNGLVYRNGVYHMYFQYNPFHVEWDNMSWGHATSTDLLHWTCKDTVLWPDEYGMMFSGSGLKNNREMLGLPKDALLYYYSAAGGTTTWSKDRDFFQGIAYSIDNGNHLTKLKDVFIPTIEKENRDPKVFWHEKSQAYIMVLWLQEDEFAVLRSTDLMEFTISQRLRLTDAFECPDLFELQIIGEEETRWVFWCADGYYYIGDFDGYTFTCGSDKLVSYANKMPYAAQTISGLDNRHVSIPWIRARFEGKPYTGTMGIPREFSLIRSKDGLRLQHNLCKEYRDARRLTRSTSNQNYIEVAMTQIPIEIEITWEGECTNDFEVKIGEEIIKVDFTNRQLSYKEEISPLFSDSTGELLSIIIDGQIVEVTTQNSTIYAVYELPDQRLTGKIELCSIQSDKHFDLNIYEIEKGN